MSKVLVFDLDGTLLNDERKIDPQNLKALKQASNQGHKIVLASGRNIKNMEDIAHQIGNVQFLITHNGGYVFDLKNQKVVFEKCLDHHLALQILEFAKTNQLNGIFYTKKDHFLINFNKNYAKVLKHFKVTLKPNFTPDDLQDVIKILLLKEDGFASVPLLLKTLHQDFDHKLTIALSSPKAIDITAPGVSKAEGLEQIMPLLNQTWDDFVTFGNGGNDITMLKKAPLSFAMGNSLPHVLEAGKSIIGDNNSLTIKETIEAKFLNKG